MEKLQLSDSAFAFRPISSMALGTVSLWILGLLHAEIVQSGFNGNLIVTVGNRAEWEYKVRLRPG